MDTHFSSALQADAGVRDGLAGMRCWYVGVGEELSDDGVVGYSSGGSGDAIAEVFAAFVVQVVEDVVRGRDRRLYGRVVPGVVLGWCGVGCLLVESPGVPLC
ncbi:MAG: hypothetical protein ACFWT0_02045 [Bifidobacterium crudilactis]|jgi:hypothetical protein|uniref:hypothetical protein n=1 Tax=Bifidobacterium crudilactis TaxID=327277 RepID=UPI003A5BDB2C